LDKSHYTNGIFKKSLKYIKVKGDYIEK